MKKADLFFNVLRLPVDFLMLMTAGVVTYLLRTRILDTFRPVLFEFNLPFDKYLFLVVGVSMLFIISYAIAGLYSMKGRVGKMQELGQIMIASSAGIMLVIIYIFLQQTLFNSRFLVMGGWFFAILFVSIGRIIVGAIQKYSVVRHGFGIHRLLLIGDDELSSKMAESITANPASGYRVVGRIHSPEISAIEAMIRDSGIDEVILANPNY